MTAPERSPSFDTPPVRQVALEVHFDRLPKVRTPHFGLFWQAIGGPEKYPDASDLFPDDVEVENADARVGLPKIDFTFPGSPPVPRSRFSNADMRVEVQDNALAVAWTGPPGSNAYPRYDTVRTHFLKILATLRDVLQIHGLGVLHVVQTEISYQNELVVGQGWTTVDDLTEVINARWLPVLNGLPTEDVHIYQRHVLHDEAGEFAGRLYTSVDSAREYEGEKSLTFGLTVRKPLRDDSPQAVVAALDAGHELIVHTFANATTDAMHRLWGRRS